jgi:hypothetical protein
MTTEQLRSIERWENEGGKVSDLRSGVPTGRAENIDESTLRPVVTSQRRSHRPRHRLAPWIVARPHQ